MDHLAFSPPDQKTLVETILVQSGYPSAERASSEMQQKVWGTASLALNIINPRCISEIRPLDRVSKEMIEVGPRQIVSARLAYLAAQCGLQGRIAFFCGTLGHAFDIMLKSLQETSTVDAFFLDSAGSVLAEHLAELIEENLRLQFGEQNLNSSRRFSPGYCDWETGSGQQVVFSFLDARAIEVRLTESGMMVPIKSISGVVLAGEQLTHRTTCPSCNKNDCSYRRKKGSAPFSVA